MKKNNLLWFLRDILLPVVHSRVLLLLAGLTAPSFIPFNSSQGAEIVTRGWIISSIRVLDMWARWDSGWYLSVIKLGYSMGENVYTMSNLAFFPVFPYLTKILSFLVPLRPTSDDILLATGLFISNLSLIISAALLYKISNKLFNSRSLARLSVYFLVAFPSAFFLSAFYTESIFLVFVLASFWAAMNKKWALAGLFSAIAGATRPTGVLMGLPLFCLYMEQRNWNFKLIDKSILWFATIPLGVWLFFTHMFEITGDFLASIKVQSAWGREFTDPLTTFLKPTGYWPFITQMDQVVMAGSLLAAAMMLLKKNRYLLPFGVYTLVMVIPTLFTGTLDSTTRFAVVLFPIFILLAKTTENRFWLKVPTLVGMFIVQLLLMALFSQSYWVG